MGEITRYLQKIKSSRGNSIFIELKYLISLIEQKADVSEVNQRLLVYQRIERNTILSEPMEMTTTKKIKRDTI